MCGQSLVDSRASFVLSAQACTRRLRFPSIHLTPFPDSLHSCCNHDSGHEHSLPMLGPVVYNYIFALLTNGPPCSSVYRSTLSTTFPSPEQAFPRQTHTRLSLQDHTTTALVINFGTLHPPTCPTSLNF